MHLKSLQLFDFRNFGRLQLHLLRRLNFFVGDNGQGKTNFLEAVHLLSRGSSFRALDSKSLVKKDGPGRARLTGLFEKNSLDYSVEMVIEVGKKASMINGKRSNAASLFTHFPTVLFSPESLAAIKEGPDLRRQLIDELLMSHNPRHAQLIREHSRALKARNRLLKNIAEGLGSRNDHEMALESLNKIYFLLSAHLSSARIRAILDIQPYFQNAMKQISGDPVGENAGEISVDYLISDQSALAWSDSQVFDALQNRHEALAKREMAYGSSLVGPHKHDIKFLFAGNDSRFYCSQGQQRALILALKTAQIVYHHEVHQTYPVLLLDDVLSELDYKKRVNLMKFLEEISAQILITATDLTWSDQFGVERNSVFTVTNGQVEPRSISKD